MASIALKRDIEFVVNRFLACGLDRIIVVDFTPDETAYSVCACHRSRNRVVGDGSWTPRPARGRLLEKACMTSRSTLAQAWIAQKLSRS